MEKIASIKVAEDLNALTESRVTDLIEQIAYNDGAEFELGKTLFVIKNREGDLFLYTYQDNNLVLVNNRSKVSFRSSKDLSAWLFNFKDGLQRRNEFENSLDLTSFQ